MEGLMQDYELSLQHVLWRVERLHQHKEIVTKRKTIVEHVFGSLRTWGHDTFFTRGLASVLAEFSLSALTYNWRRALQVVGVERLMAAMALEPS